ncbi:hypothetical protein [Paraburkholderia kururiensis]|jgi:hypothetical protein|uniref:hypothetical protein n=1 Tax=Paraburkholderia kururiensis TaxID=984307 RepID=UPI0018F40E0C|nr:hypothetical protein [Paraburkholderia kururiensis]
MPRPAIRENLPETRLCRWYGMCSALSTFDAALAALIDAGMVERIAPLHVQLK